MIMKLVLSVRALNALTATFYALAIGSGIALNMIKSPTFHTVTTVTLSLIIKSTATTVSSKKHA